MAIPIAVARIIAITQGRTPEKKKQSEGFVIWFTYDIPQAIMSPYQAIFSPSIPKRFSIAYQFKSLFPRFSQSTRSIR